MSRSTNYQLVFLAYLGIVLFFGCTSSTNTSGADSGIDGSSDTDTGPAPLIERVDPSSAKPSGETVTIIGKHFGPTADPGVTLLSGLTVVTKSWSPSEVTFVVPKAAVSGKLRIRTAKGLDSNVVDFEVDRSGSGSSYQPIGFELNPEDHGLMGAATGVAVEPDGSFLYQMSGWDVLTTFNIQNPFDATVQTPDYDAHYRVTSRIYFPQRITWLKLLEGYLFCAGDFGLRVYSTSSLQQGSPAIIAAVADSSFYSVDAARMIDAEDEITVALSQYRPNATTPGKLRVYVYRLFTSANAFVKIGDHLVFNNPLNVLHRLLTVALETTHKRLYLSSKTSLTGGQINAFDIAENADGTVSLTAAGEKKYNANAGAIPFWLQAGYGRVWTSVDSLNLPQQKSIRYFEPSATEPFGEEHAVTVPSYTPVPNPLPDLLPKVHAARFHIVDEETLAIIDGTADSVHRFDVATLHGCKGDCEVVHGDHTALTADWPHGVTGYPEQGTKPGAVFVADEWGGVVPFFFSKEETLSWPEEMSRHHIHTGCWAQRLYVADERVYVAARGGGLWSLKKSAVSDATDWRRSAWNWDEEYPQPYPVTALATRRYDGMNETFVVARGHPKAFGWGSDVQVILYKESGAEFVELDTCPMTDTTAVEGEELRYALQGDAVWPEEDLAFVTAWEKGVHAYVVDPEQGRITQVTADNELIPDNADDRIVAMHYHDGTVVVGFDRFGNEGGGLRRYTVQYEDNLPPDRSDPDRAIAFADSLSLFVRTSEGIGPDIKALDINAAGVVAAVTSEGLTLFNLDDFENGILFADAKVNISNWKNLGDVPNVSDGTFGGVAFDEDNPEYLYVLNDGLWCLHLKPSSQLNAPELIAYYPMTSYYNGHRDVEGTGLTGWSDPDVYTIHQASDLVVKNKEIFTIGWPGTVQKITLTATPSP